MWLYLYMIVYLREKDPTEYNGWEQHVANMLKEDRLKVGITDGLVRLSIGLEDPADLIASLKASLDALM